MTHLLDGQTALVTGASGGIGRAIARRLAEEGAAVALHCRTAATAAHETAAAIGDRATVVQGDLRDEQTCHRIVREAEAWGGGRLTALVNNAAVQPVQSLPGMTVADWRTVVDTNLTSVFACTQAAAELMRAQPGGGTITHIASIEATHPAPGHAHYSASKAAVVMHARAAALEYGPSGIRVNTVSPGLIDREGLEEAWPEGVRRWQEAAPTGRLGSPEDVANAVVFLLSPLASWISGHNLVVDGGVSARPTW
ncbi:3-oxoacyl-[acyl-carrier protein] reductase [Streptomyces sp. Ag109_O5-1]|uniref:SDR family NAD(P)-dependent oxidoreductase n=1 Tax=Streptomyces sp. Ag109_O5-1 TaxID=1938851 RepID=UPI000F4DB9AD|nr:SDR family oxidoreductase [Streptomyces sp. Ag109_O5-1]RPE42617.1 3-oxoacyl-[acyl-carrier protein] reductase [Streptomyces sp. Ag109_O5-1]